MAPLQPSAESCAATGAPGVHSAPNCHTPRGKWVLGQPVPGAYRKDSSMWWSGGLPDITVRAEHAEPGHSSPNPPIPLHTVGHTGVPTASTRLLHALPTWPMGLETPVVSGTQGKAEGCQKNHPKDKSYLLQPQNPREARVLRLGPHAKFQRGGALWSGEAMPTHPPPAQVKP